MAEPLTTFRAVRDRISATVKAGQPLAIHLALADHSLRDEVYEAGLVITWPVTEAALTHRLANAIVPIAQHSTMDTFRDQHHRQGDTAAGRAVASQVFPTIIGGIQLQLIFIETWTGSEHSRATKEVWLINGREPMKVITGR
jgi:hypothetical protein